MQVMQIPSRIHDYSVHFTGAPDYSFEPVPGAFYAVDENVWRLHQDGALARIDRQRLLVVKAEEQRKSLEGVQEIWQALLEVSARRNSTLVSIGGGIVQDITGFAASTLFRGIKWVFVPTTLLAQADSCIGAKTSLNYGKYKNLLGTFYPPHRIEIATRFLDTLTEADYFSGLGEVIKLHLMGGEQATRTLVGELPALRKRDHAAMLRAIRRSLEIKIDYFTGDEFDGGRRNLLNFGHCFGHALEASSDFAIPHGQAVLIGILFANIVAQKRGILSRDEASAIEKPLLADNVVTRPVREHFDEGRIVDAFKKDKKRTGAGLPLIVMGDRHAMSRVDDLTPAEIGAAMGDLAGLLGVEARPR